MNIIEERKEKIEEFKEKMKKRKLIYNLFQILSGILVLMGIIFFLTQRFFGGIFSVLAGLFYCLFLLVFSSSDEKERKKELEKMEKDYVELSLSVIGKIDFTQPTEKQEITQYTKCGYCGYETPVQFKKCSHCGAVL